MNRGHTWSGRSWASRPQAARARRPAVGAAAARRLVVAGLVLAGCSHARGLSTAAPSSTRVETTGTPVTTSAPFPCPANPPAPVGAGGGPSLANLFVTVPPAYQQVDDTAGDSGPTNVDALAKEDSEPGALAALQQAGYVRGYERTWAKSTPEDRVTVGIYLFATGPGAAGYLRRVQAQDAEPASDGTVPTRFPVPDVPGASGWVTAGSTGGSATVDYAKCAYLATVEVDGSAAEGNPALAAHLAADQFAKL